MSADLTPVLGESRALEACRAAVDGARAAGADEAEAFLTGRAGSWTRFAEDRISQPQDITEWQLMVRASVGGRSARIATTDLAAAREAGARAATRARVLTEVAGPLPVLPAPAAAPALPPLGADVLWAEDTAGWDVGARVGTARTASSAARAAGGSAFGVLGQAVGEVAVVTADGSTRYAAGTEALGSLTVRVGDGTSHWVDLDRRLGVLAVDAAVATTVEEAVRGQGRRELPAGRYDVVFGPLATGGLLEGFESFGFSGDAVADGVGAVATRQGERVAPASVDVADDPRARRGLPFPFDLEGTPSSRVPLLDHGVVGGAVTDRASAARAGLAATGHAHIAREETPHPTPSSLTMAAGDASTAELLAGVERGVYVQRLWYLRVVDPVATTLTGGSRDACFLVEDGRLAGALAPARFTESVFGALSRVDAIGRDVLAQPLPNVWNGAVTAPAVRVRGFRFGPHGSPPPTPTPTPTPARG
ncbi:TldD/PmbA family protein [Microlunatus capsulatus]|uniref:TldD/PmbA family protein n=1 Tax=Microlunatus capsulatus TaxID=99117 RepID=UPI0031DAE194